MPVIGGPDIVTDSLVLYLDAGNPKSYPLDGSIVYDLSDNENHGSLITGAYVKNENTGVFYFDGNGANVEVPTSSTLDSLVDMTVETWFYFEGTTNEYGGICWFYKDTNDRVYIRIYNNSGLQGYSVFNSVSSSWLLTGTGIVKLDTWHHLVWMIEGTVWKVYLDLKLIHNEDESKNMSDVANGYKFRLGNVIAANSFFKGSMFGGKIYNRALSFSEVKQNYNALKGRFGL